MPRLLLLSTSMHSNCDLRGLLDLLAEGIVLHLLALQVLVGVRAACWHGLRVVIIVILAMAADCELCLVYVFQPMCMPALLRSEPTALSPFACACYTFRSYTHDVKSPGFLSILGRTRTARNSRSPS